MVKKIIVAFLVVIIVGMIGIGVVKVMPSNERIDPITYFGEFKSTQQNMVFNDERVEWEKPVIIEKDIIYIEIGWFNKFVNDRVYYDINEEIITITNLEEVIRIYPSENRMTKNEKDVDVSIDTIIKEGKAYISENYLEEEYAFDIEPGNDGRVVIASTNKEDTSLGEVRKNSKIRTHADSKKPIVDDVNKGEQVVIYGQAGKHLRVRNENGFVGYIPEGSIKVIGEVEQLQEKNYTAQQLANPLNDKVKMVWDQMTVRMTGDWTSSKYTNISDANVISPTWFEFADAEGNLIDRGTTAYVEQAHERGLQVWPLMSHNFVKTQLTKEILTSTTKRQHVIDQLITLTQKYNVEGINIDIENVQQEFGPDWVQFMRELYPQMQTIGKTVSVDVYMPSAWSMYYERGKVSEVVDYFMVMAYDQHWGGSETAGPTAGLTWVEQGIQANLQEVPAEKLVLGIPFFTRIWEETAEGLTSKAYGMQAALNTVSKWGVEAYYDEEHGQDYAQRKQGDVVYHVWLEDEETIAKRIALIEKYDLAGYAGWKLGLEGSSIWNELDKMK